MAGIALILISIAGILTCKKRMADCDKSIKECKELLGKPGLYKHIPRKINDLEKSQKTCRIITYALIAMIALGVFATVIEMSSSQEKDKITKEEKEWLENNLGDGKYDEIQDAIDDYKNK